MAGNRKVKKPLSRGLGYNARNVWSGDKPTPHPEEQMQGLHLGQVMDDYDEQRMGRIWVYIPSGSTKRTDEQSIPLYGGTAPDKDASELGFDERLRLGWILVSPLLPFYGTDEYRNRSAPDGRNSFAGSVNSYGMWLQPRIGDYVGVMFAGGDPNNGFWIGMAVKPNSNAMVPGIPGEDPNNIQNTQDDNIIKQASSNAKIPTLSKLSSQEDPTGENVNVVSDLARNQILAGVSGDQVRGSGTSGARRESPSYVIGIKSAGWSYDSEKGNINSDGTKFRDREYQYSDKNSVGHQFIMDDHPDHQSVRLRTSEGSQVLMHDACQNPFIYIQTASGNAWIEMGNSGDISIYSKSGIHIHTEGDYNLSVDGNMNVGVKGNVHWRTGGDYSLGIDGAANYSYSDNLTVGIEGQYDFRAGDNSRLTYEADADIIVGGDSITSISGSVDNLIAGNYNNSTKGNYNITVNGSSSKQITGNENIISGAEVKIKSSGKFSLTSNGDLAADANSIYWNSGQSSDPDEHSDISLKAVPAKFPILPNLYSNLSAPTRSEAIMNQTTANESTTASVVPQHQPWGLRCGIGATPATNGLVSSQAVEGAIIPPSDNNSCNRFNNPDNFRNGASVSNALIPEQVVGGTESVDGQIPVISDGMAYETSSKAEKPLYRSVRLASEEETHTPDSLSLSDDGREKIKMRETFIARPIRDPLGNDYVVGYGHKIKYGDTVGGVFLDSQNLEGINRFDNDNEKTLQITEDEAESFLERELEQTQNWLRNKFPNVEFTQGQWDSIVSFTHNVTPQVLETDEVGKQWAQAIENGNFDIAASKMLSFSYVGGAIDCNMLDRRRSEIRDIGNFTDKDGILNQSIGAVPNSEVYRVAGFEINQDVFQAICSAEQSVNGVPAGYFLMMAAQKSGCNANAKAKNGTGAGLFLITVEEGTRHGLSKNRDLNSEVYNPDRNSATYAAIVTEQKNVLESYGIQNPGATELYITNFMGLGQFRVRSNGEVAEDSSSNDGSIKFLREYSSNPSGIPAEDPSFRVIVKNNPSIFYFKGEISSPRTYRDVYQLMDGKITKRLPLFADACANPPPLSSSKVFRWTASKRQPNFEGVNPKIRAIVEKSAREAGIRSLGFNSGFRTRNQNRRAGGAQKSQHLTGNAIDIGVADISTEQKRTFIEKLAQNGATGLGVGSRVIHADVRDSGRVTWRYSGGGYANDILRKYGFRGA